MRPWKALGSLQVFIDSTPPGVYKRPTFYNFSARHKDAYMFTRSMALPFSRIDTGSIRKPASSKLCEASVWVKRGCPVRSYYTTLTAACTMDTFRHFARSHTRPSSTLSSFQGFRNQARCATPRAPVRGCCDGPPPGRAREL